MPTEIERRFLVPKLPWIEGQPEPIMQGYLCTDPERTVRVRLKGGVTTTDMGGIVPPTAFITIKGQKVGASAPEFEYVIPHQDAAPLLDLCLHKVEKDRYYIEVFGTTQPLTWEIDVFHGPLEGLIIAEVELSSEDQQVVIPDWVGEEITTDGRYSNAALALNGRPT